SITDSLIWVNDIETAEPVKDAKVEIGNIAETFTTDEDGIVTFETPDEWKLSWEDRSSDFIKITAPDGKILISQIIPYSSESLQNHYWQSFSTDRPMYQPTDTIKFWGFLKPKKSAAPLQDLTVRLEYDWNTFVKEIPIKLESDGTFLGELDINSFSPGYYNLYVYSGDKQVAYAGIQVSDYIKPAYDFSVEANKKAVFFDEEIAFTVKSNYFDGTPVPNLEFQYDEDYSYKSHLSKTDKDGQAFIKASPQKGTCTDEYCYDVHSYYFSAEIANAEEADIRASNSVRVFDSHLAVTGSSEIENGQAKIDVKTDWIDLSQLNDDSNVSYNDYLGKAAADRNVTVNISEIYWEKLPDGEYYDFINKKVVKQYRYEKSENHFDKFDIETDKNGEASYQFKPNEGKYYRVNLVSTDDQGNDAHDIIYVYNGGRSNSYNFYEVNILNGEEDEDSWSSKNMFDIGETVKTAINNGDTVMDDVDAEFMFMQFSNGLQNYDFSDSQYYDFEFGKEDVPNVFVSAVWFDGQHYETAYQASAAYKKELERLNIEIETDEKYYSPGDEVTLKVDVSDTDGRPAQAKVNLNLVDEAFFSVAYDNFSDPLDDIYANNSSGVLVAYDSHDNPISSDEMGGKGGCFTAETKILMADGTYKEIQDIEIGDIVLTKDHEFSGKLVAAKVSNTVSHFVSEYLVFNEDLEVTDIHIVYVNGGWDMAGNVKVGDSMLNKAGEEVEISSIRKVVEPVWVYNFEVDGKHTYFANDFYVHNDKGGDGGVRNNFKDTALFDVVETDSGGNGEITFTLPDNITSWRVTARAIDGDNLRAGYGSTEVVVSLPFFADLIMNREYSVKDEPIVKFRAYGDSLDEGDEVEFIVSAESLGEIASDKIDGEAFEGGYYELPKLKLGNHEITLFAESGKFDDALQEEIEVKGSRLKENINELLRDVSGKTKFEIAADGPTAIKFTDGGIGYYYSNLWSLYYSNGDRLDQRLSQVIGAELLEEYFDEAGSFDDSDVSANYQEEGLTLLPYSDPDLRLSALALYIETNPSRYDSYELKKYFYGFYKQTQSNLEEIVLSLLGLASMNEPVLLSLREIQHAPELNLKERLYIALAFDALGSSGEAMVIYKDVLGQLAEDNNAYETALGAMIAASLQDDEASALLWEFVEIHGFEDDLDNLVKIGYVKNSIEHSNPNPVKFEVKVGDHSESVKLEKWESFSIMAYPGDETSVSVLDGELAANLNYAKIVEPEAFEKDERLYIHRAYLVDGKETTEFKEGDLVKVFLDIRFDGNIKRPYFKITDVLPSGLRLVSDIRGPDSYYDYTYPYRKNGQEVYFSWYQDDYSPSKTINYYARVVNPGEFYADPAKVESYYDPSIANISESNTVTILR
ncbi:MAG: polymorphic toxin-type HINT domain-containing protein, partial [bacterium]|nr:polymorphic toxin-type HINT domain-containing protein [bacterium]